MEPTDPRDKKQRARGNKRHKGNKKKASKTSQPKEKKKIEKKAVPQKTAVIPELHGDSFSIDKKENNAADFGKTAIVPGLANQPIDQGKHKNKLHKTEILPAQPASNSSRRGVRHKSPRYRKKEKSPFALLWLWFTVVVCIAIVLSIKFL